MRLLAALVVVLMVAGSAAVVIWSRQAGTVPEEILMHTVAASDFESFVTEDGDIESSLNVEIRCEVRSQNTAGATILRIVPEGTVVEEGDFLIQFDDSVLRNDLTEQEILVAQDRAAVIQAQSDLSSAEKTLVEYEQGIYEQERELLESEVFVAEENLRRAQAVLEYSSRLAARGFMPAIELDANRFAVAKAESDVAVARRKLDVYDRFTNDRMTAEYQAEIEKARANLDAAEFTLELSQRKRDEIQEQIENCTVLAPSPGQVVYANDTERRADDAIIIEEGARIRDGQVVIFLPDPRQMQADTLINETRINEIREGSPARITLDSDPDLGLQGTVQQVNAFPYPQRWFGGPMEYGTIVRIEDPPPELRPGLRAKVHIFVHREPNVLQVPISSVLENNGRHYCLLVDSGQWEAREVRVGPHNESFVIVRQGLEAGEEVAVNPYRYVDRIEFPSPSTGPLAGGSDRPAPDRS